MHVRAGGISITIEADQKGSLAWHLILTFKTELSLCPGTLKFGLLRLLKVPNLHTSHCTYKWGRTQRDGSFCVPCNRRRPSTMLFCPSQVLRSRLDTSTAAHQPIASIRYGQSFSITTFVTFQKAIVYKCPHADCPKRATVFSRKYEFDDHLAAHNGKYDYGPCAKRLWTKLARNRHVASMLAKDNAKINR